MKSRANICDYLTDYMPMEREKQAKVTATLPKGGKEDHAQVALAHNM